MILFNFEKSDYIRIYSSCKLNFEVIFCVYEYIKCYVSVVKYMYCKVVFVRHCGKLRIF